MSHRPVCVRCQCEMKPEKVGIQVIDMTTGEPYQVWSGDKQKCPKCGFEIICGFGNYAWAVRGESDFGDIISIVVGSDNYVKCNVY